MANNDNFQLDPSLNLFSGSQSQSQSPDLSLFGQPNVAKAQPVSFQDLSQYLGQQSQGTAPPRYGPLSVIRQQYAAELQHNPDLTRRLMASVQAEVGDQGNEAKLAYIESVMNRAAARGKSLHATISDPNYYPETTTSKLGQKISQADQAILNPLINHALAGSNLSSLATGNESGKVRSGGAPITYNPGTGERFVVENHDANWAKSMSPPAVVGSDVTPPAQQSSGGPQFQDLSQYLTKTT